MNREIQLILFKVGLLLLTVGFSSWASARAQLIVAKSGETGTILLQGAPGDLDGTNFYELMAMAPAEEGGRLTKRVSFTESGGVKTVDFVCVSSKVVANLASCTVILRKGPGVSIGSGASYELAGADAERMKQLFKIPAGGGEIFRSNDNHFSLQSGDGTFLIIYK